MRSIAAKALDRLPARASLDQLTLAQFLAGGGYDRHVRRVRFGLPPADATGSAAAIAQDAPHVRISGIAAGLHALLELPGGQTEDEIVARAAQRGLAVEGLEHLQRGRSAARPCARRRLRAGRPTTRSPQRWPGCWRCSPTCDQTSTGWNSNPHGHQGQWLLRPSCLTNSTTRAGRSDDTGADQAGAGAASPCSSRRRSAGCSTSTFQACWKPRIANAIRSSCSGTSRARQQPDHVRRDRRVGEAVLVALEPAGHRDEREDEQHDRERGDQRQHAAAPAHDEEREHAGRARCRSAAAAFAPASASHAPIEITIIRNAEASSSTTTISRVAFEEAFFRFGCSIATSAFRHRRATIQSRKAGGRALLGTDRRLRAW